MRKKYKDSKEYIYIYIYIYILEGPKQNNKDKNKIFLSINKK